MVHINEKLFRVLQVPIEPHSFARNNFSDETPVPTIILELRKYMIFP